MNRQSSFWFAFGTIAIAFVAVVTVVVYGLLVSDAAGQKLGIIGTAAAGVVGLVGLLVLVVYTRETFLLRKTAEEQNEANIKPVVRLDLSSTNDKSTEPMKLTFRLENVGVGPALNIKVEPLVYSGHTTQILEESLISEKSSVPCRMEEDGSFIPGRERTLYFLKLSVQNHFPESLPAAIEFCSLSGYDTGPSTKSSTTRRKASSVQNSGVWRS